MRPFYHRIICRNSAINLPGNNNELFSDVIAAFIENCASISTNNNCSEEQESKVEVQYNFVYPTIVGPDDYTRLYLCSDIAI